MGTIQVIYVSTATKELDEAQLRELLESCVRHNKLSDITGLLLYSAGSFMQVLEGEEAAVDETLARIAADPRNHGIIVIHRDPIENREFRQWAMGFSALSSGDAKSWPGYAPFFARGFDAASLCARPGLALEILKAVA